GDLRELRSRHRPFGGRIVVQPFLERGPHLLAGQAGGADEEDVAEPLLVADVPGGERGAGPLGDAGLLGRRLAGGAGPRPRGGGRSAGERPSPPARRPTSGTRTPGRPQPVPRPASGTAGRPPSRRRTAGTRSTTASRRPPPRGRTR